MKTDTQIKIKDLLQAEYDKNNNDTNQSFLWRFAKVIEENLESLSPPQEEKREVSEWIDVDEKLPEERQVVLLYIPRYNNISTGYLDSEGNLQRHCEHIIGVVTHWQPLPSPPQSFIKERGEGK